MKRYRFLLCMFLAVALPSNAVLARGSMPEGLPSSIDRAVDICLNLISGQAPRQRGQFKKTPTGYSRSFSETEAGVLDSKSRLNNSGNPRVEIVFKPDRVCSIFVFRLAGGYKNHFSQLRAAFDRRGWRYKRKGLATLQKGDRLLSTRGATTSRDRAGDVLTNFNIIEWVRSGSGRLERRY